MGDETAALGHTFENGICTVCGTGIAINVTTNTAYATLAEALNAAASGETVKLLGDCMEEKIVVAPCSLITGADNVVLDEENGMVPVYNSEGYIFTKAGFAISQAEDYTGEGIKINAVAYPVNMAVADLLKDGAADNNLQVMIVLTWNNEQGTGSQKFVFTDEVVASGYSSNNGTWDSYSKMFSMVITGIENVENLRANIMLVSGTNAEYSTAPLSIN